MEQNSTRADPWFLFLGLHRNTDPCRLACYKNWWEKSVRSKHAGGNNCDIHNPSGSSDKLHIPHCVEDHCWNNLSKLQYLTINTLLFMASEKVLL